MRDSHEIGQAYTLDGLDVLIVDYVLDTWIISIQKNLNGVEIQFPFVPIAEPNLTNYTGFARPTSVVKPTSITGQIGQWVKSGNAHFIIDVEEIWNKAVELFDLEDYVSGMEVNDEESSLLLMPAVYPARAKDIDRDDFNGRYFKVDEEIGEN